MLQSVSVYGGKLFAQYEQNAVSQLKLFDLEGKKDRDIALPGLGTVFGATGRWNQMRSLSDSTRSRFHPSIYRVPLKPVLTTTLINGTPSSLPVHDETTLWSKVDAPSIDPSAYEVAQEWFKSKDGTRVPMFVVHKKGLQKDGKNPTLLTAYGGFNVSLTPTFSRTAYLWLEHGGVVRRRQPARRRRVRRRLAPRRHARQEAERLRRLSSPPPSSSCRNKYHATRTHLAIQGGSNGGLLMGAVMTQRPDLFRAVVCQVPLLDMLRYQNFQIARLWIPEYGSAEDAEQFKWLYALLPLSPREAGHGVSRDPIHDRRFRHPRRPDAREKDGRRDASRSQERPEQDASNPAAD